MKVEGRKPMAIINDKAIALDNGTFLQPQNGKYESGITLITKDNVCPKWERVNYEADGNPFALYGSFRISKKGRPVFDLTEEKKHQLINIRWGGCFDKTRGLLPEEIKERAVFTVRKSSNGGGMGHTYAVLPIDFNNKIADWE